MRQLLIFILLLSTLLCNAQHKTVDEVLREAEVLITKKEYQKAVEVYSEGIKRHSDNPELFRDRGIIYFILKEYRKAVEDFSKIIDINKGSVPFAYFNRGICRLSLNEGQTSSGCADLAKAKELGYEAIWSDFSLVCPILN